MNNGKEIVMLMVCWDGLGRMDEQEIQTFVNKEADAAFSTIHSKSANYVTTARKQEVEAMPTYSNTAVSVKANKPRANIYHGENFKPSHIDIIPDLLNSQPIICIDDIPYVYRWDTGYYEALSLENGEFRKFVYRHCPSWFRRELNPHILITKLYHDLIRFFQAYLKDRCFTGKEIEATAERFISTNDMIYEIETGNAYPFQHNMLFVQKELNLNILPVYQNKLPNIETVVNFIDDISGGSEQVKNLFKGFLGCLFANNEYNPKKIAVLYGNNHTIKTIVKFIEGCLGRDKVSHIPLDKLTDKHALQEIERKPVNISSLTDSHTLISELGEIICTLGNEYIYAGNKADECTILNNKCFILCTDDSLKLKALVDSVDSLDSVLLIPIQKAVDKAKDINGKVSMLKPLGGYIFFESMITRKTLEDNDWQFEQLPDITEALKSAKERECKKVASEVDEFIMYLEERYDFDKDKMVKQTELKADCEEYCKNRSRLPFSKEIITTGINIRLGKVFDITAEEYQNTYNKTYNKTNRGKPKNIDGKDVWMYWGIGWKSPRQQANGKT